MLSRSEESALGVFRQFLVTPGEMLCFYGPNLEKHRSALRQLMARDFLVKEEFHGAYSLTRAGYAAMKTCTN